MQSPARTSHLPVKAKADRIQTNQLREANAYRCQPLANSRQLLLSTMVNDNMVSPLLGSPISIR